MSDEIRPALTAEQWRDLSQASALEAKREVLAESIPDGDKRYVGGGWHALAAVCLYQQPFGFTQEDVRGLRKMVANSTAFSSEWLECERRLSATCPPFPVVTGRTNDRQPNDACNAWCAE